MKKVLLLLVIALTFVSCQVEDQEEVFNPTPENISFEDLLYDTYKLSSEEFAERLLEFDLESMRSKSNVGFETARACTYSTSSGHTYSIIGTSTGTIISRYYAGSIQSRIIGHPDAASALCGIK